MAESKKNKQKQKNTQQLWIRAKFVQCEHQFWIPEAFAIMSGQRFPTPAGAEGCKD